MPNVKICSVAGVTAAGATCAETLTGVTSDMTDDEFLDFLEPSEAEGRAGAVCMSSKDFSKLKKEFETACRLLGKNCPANVRTSIKNMSLVLPRSS